MLNVPCTTDLNYLRNLILDGADQDCDFTDFRCGKPHNQGSNIVKSILFKVNSAGIEHLFTKLNGALPIISRSAGKLISIKIPFRINTKAWMCKDCFKLGTNSDLEEQHDGVAASEGRPLRHNPLNVNRTNTHRCRGKLCARCGSSKHNTAACSETGRYCVNCRRSGHRARDVNCPTHLLAITREIRKIDLPLEYLEDQDLRFILLKALMIK